ncbi:MAG: KpsF/GutQ family sugar-phosphate isomerase [Caldimicrobium sp.]
MDNSQILKRAIEILQTEKEGLEEVIKNLDSSFVSAVNLILNSSGRVVVTGVGKSGLIGKKISATLSSTGTPSFFLHPVEALHGDLGMVTSGDILLALSYSGNTLEVCEVVKILKNRNIPVIAMTGNAESVLAGLSDVVINTAIPREACPFNLAPTTSTTAMLALGDALAIVLFELRGLQAEDFRKNHPGGTLGERLKVKVKEIMLKGDKIPLVREGTPLSLAIEELDRKRLGAVLIVNALGHLSGILTDGDLRRIVTKHKGLPEVKIEEVMTKNPKRIEENRLAAEALELMEKHLITVLPVVNYDGLLVGILHLHDILGKGTFKFVV